MALANFFDKINLGASQVLKTYDSSAFESKLLSNCICVQFGNEALERFEGRITLDLLIRLLARLYPNIKLNTTGLHSQYESFVEQLKTIARQINPVINLEDNQQETFVIGVGHTLTELSNAYYIGSDNWKAYYSTTTPQSIGSSQNPFGAAGTACIVCANLFRAIFNDELANPGLDSDVCLCMYNQTINGYEDTPGLPKEIDINFTLIGAGAIGNAALWSLLQLPNATGQISLIDNQTVSISNLQRYVLMIQDHVTFSKVEIIKELFHAKTGITIQPYPYRWQEIVGKLSIEEMRLMATALDTGIDRLLVQSTIPEKIINAWTSPECLGVSRHFDFLNDVCLACLYMPTAKVKSESEKIAGVLNMPEQEGFIRQYLAKNIPINEQFVVTVSHFGGIDQAKLRRYMNQPVRILYSDGICGGGIITVNSDTHVPQDMEVPLAHESAMAGILLAAEVVIESLKLRAQPIEALTKINLLRPLHQHLREKEDKHYSGKCLCQDSIVQKRYSEKWERSFPPVL
ncbi:MAG: ThiF family protein [Chitinophagaceae bacterium]|nr:ThiF family protein [Chitinophagaceae bacterium]